MISLSCLAWLSVVMVQAVVHFFFFGKNDVVNEQPPQQREDPKSQPSSETDSGTSSPSSETKGIHSDHSLKCNGQKINADERDIRDTALQEEVQGQICPSESSPPCKSLQMQNRVESDVSMDSTCERSDSTTKTYIGSSQNSSKIMDERYRPQSPTQFSSSSHNDCDNCSPAGENPNDCDCDSIQEDDEWRLRILKHYYEQGCSLSGSTAEYHETINMVCKRLQQQDKTRTNNVSPTRAAANRGFYGMSTASIPCVSA